MVHHDGVASRCIVTVMIHLHCIPLRCIIIILHDDTVCHDGISPGYFMMIHHHDVSLWHVVMIYHVDMV